MKKQIIIRTTAESLNGLRRALKSGYLVVFATKVKSEGGYEQYIEYILEKDE